MFKCEVMHLGTNNTGNICKLKNFVLGSRESEKNWGIVVVNYLNISSHYDTVSQRAKVYMNWVVLGWNRDVALSLFVWCDHSWNAMFCSDAHV